MGEVRPQVQGVEPTHRLHLVYFNAELDGASCQVVTLEHLADDSGHAWVGCGLPAFGKVCGWTDGPDTELTACFAHLVASAQPGVPLRPLLPPQGIPVITYPPPRGPFD